MEIGIPEEELKSTKIWQYLSSLSDDYSTKAIQFVNFTAPLLASIEQFFPFYTRHDAHHGFRVLLRIEQILEDKCLIKNSPIALTADETLLLICSSYAHDLGMTIFPNEDTQLCAELKLDMNSDWKTNPQLQEYLRKHHSERGGQFISQYVGQCGVPQNLIYLLGKLMEAHNLSINELDNQLGKRVAAGLREIDLKQLACILCIADAIEFSQNRVLDGVLEQLKKKVSETEDPTILLSYKHNLQSIAIGDSVAVGEDGKIIFTGTFSNPEVMSLAHNTVDLIETWVRNYTDLEFQSKIKRLRVRGDSVIREFHIIGYDFERIGIRIKKENIIELIASNATWTSDPAIVLRELCQNSVEACRYRKFHSPDYYEPQIELFINSKSKKINIVDNGCGMSRNIILNNFLTVGNSRSFDPSYTTVGYSSLARFGIGFWAVFTIAEKAIISSAPFEYQQSNRRENINGLEFEVSIEEFKDYTIFKQIQRLPGTSIELHLKQSVNINELHYKISYHIGCSKIPIIVHFDNEQPYAIPERILLPSFEQIFGLKSDLVRQYNVRESIYENCIEDIEISIKLLYLISPSGQINFVFPNNSHIVSIVSIYRNLQFRGMAICGFLFNYLPGNTIIDVNRVGFFSANALNPKGYIFTINRLGVIGSDKYKEFIKILSNEIHNAYRKLLTATNSNTAEDIFRLNVQSRLNGGENYGSHVPQSYSQTMMCNTDLISFKLYELNSNQSIDARNITFLYFRDIVQKDYTLWLYATPYYFSEVRISNKTTQLVYTFIRTICDYKENNFILEHSREADMLADNSIDYIVDTRFKINNVPLPIRRFKSNNTDTNRSSDFILGEVKGKWSGIVVERKIIGANFSFLSQYHLVVAEGSLLAKDFRDFFSMQLNFKIAEIIGHLFESIQGFVDPSIEIYLE